jgi:DNA-3-methyladenine glycosylase
MRKLTKEFYIRKDVVTLAKELLGKKLCTNINGIYTAGIITETEAYAGEHDKASHAYNNKRTARNEVMYHTGGVAYVYLCYGLHHLFNVVTNVKDVPHAVLIRAIKPMEGIEAILLRRKHKALAKNTAAGPGTVSQALGISTKLNGTNLHEESIWIEDIGISFTKREITATPRIGVDYAGEDAKLPYRFLVNDVDVMKKLKNPTR